MSWKALLGAVRDRIRDQLDLDQATCETTFDGQPPPRCGKLFVAIHRGRRANQDAATGRVMLDQRYEVSVTVTMRVNEPYDRLGNDLLLKASVGMEARVNAIIAAVQRDAYDHVVVNAANAALADDDTGDPPIGFREPLKYLDDSEPQLVGGSWFHASPEAQEAGIKVVIRFGGARRMQHLLAMS